MALHVVTRASPAALATVCSLSANFRAAAGAVVVLPVV